MITQNDRKTVFMIRPSPRKIKNGHNAVIQRDLDLLIGKSFWGQSEQICSDLDLPTFGFHNEVISTINRHHFQSATFSMPSKCPSRR
jgi:hypothetical protein